MPTLHTCTIISAHKKKYYTSYMRYYPSRLRNGRMILHLHVLLKWLCLFLILKKKKYCASFGIYLIHCTPEFEKLKFSWSLIFLPWPRGMQYYISHFSSRYSPLPLVIMTEWLHARVTVSVSRVQTRIWMP